MSPLLQSKAVLESCLPESQLQHTMQNTRQHNSSLRARVRHLAALSKNLMA